jgi:adenylate cyclase
MTDKIFNDILRQREEKNERIVAYARFTFIAFASLMDLLSYFNWIQYTAITPNLRTLALDSVFVFFSALILFLVKRARYHSSLKFFTISLDFIFVGIMLIYDPTVAKEVIIISWISMFASVFIFMNNLIRFSKAATIYSAVLSVLFLPIIPFMIHGELASDTIPMLFGLIMLLSIGYYITVENIKMMREANTKKMMERFLPPQLMDELYKKQDNLTVGGKYQKVTILFSDIRSFTELSEALPAEQVVSLLNDYLSTMTEIIFTHEGTIDKFIGDAIMTMYGAPLQRENDEERAILTALDMLHGLKQVNKRHPELKAPLQIGIGIHTGDVIVGNIGSEKRLDYTVIGDNVNLSSRIEGLTKYYKCPILISEKTLDSLLAQNSNSFLFREVDTVQVKGKSISIKIYQVLCHLDDIHLTKFTKLKNDFETGLNFYKSKQFVEARIQFSSIQNDPLSDLYIERCKNFIQNPPEANWSGVFVMNEK